MTVPAELDRRFREAAVRSGLLDAGYDIVDSPVGALLVAATDRGILRISFDPVPEQETRAPRTSRRPTRAARAGAPRSAPARARRVLRGPAPCIRPLARPPRDDTVHRAGARRARPRPVRTDCDLCRARDSRRQSEGGEGGRDGDEPQPDPDRAAVPPDHRSKRQPRRLRRRTRAQGDSCSGSRACCSDTRDGWPQTPVSPTIEAMRLALATTARRYGDRGFARRRRPARAIGAGAGGRTSVHRAAARGDRSGGPVQGTPAPARPPRPARQRRCLPGDAGGSSSSRRPLACCRPAASEGSPPTHGRWGRPRASPPLSAPSPSSPTGGRRRWPMQPICSPARCRASSAPRPVSPAWQSSRQACGHGYGLPLLGCRRSADAVWRPVAAQSSSR